MALIPSVKKFKHYQYNLKTMAYDGLEFGEYDVSRFLTARSERDYSGLLQRYSAGAFPLFGLKDVEDDTDLTNLDDCKNMQTLMKASIALYTIAHKPSSIYENPSLLESVQGISLASLKESEYLSEVLIPLSPSPETESYLMTGVANKPPSFVRTILQRTNDDLVILHLFPSPLTVSVQAKAMELLDALSRIMIGNVTMVVDNNQPIIVSHSVASSLWLALMEVENHDAVIYCEECGSPCIAKPKRRNARRFCSDRCRQKHHRRSK